MTEEVTRRYYFGQDLALTYNARGWALLHKGEGLLATDQYPEAIDVPYEEGKTLLQFVRGAMEQGLGDSL